jgi:S1-C subfamily serine protease
VVRGWLGVEGQDLSKQLMGSIDLSQPYGVIITDIDADGPGEKAGLKRGDIIIKINGRAIFGAIDILNLIAAGKPDDVFRIEGIRQRQSFMTDAVLSQRPLMSH